MVNSRSQSFYSLIFLSTLNLSGCSNESSFRAAKNATTEDVTVEPVQASGTTSPEAINTAPKIVSNPLLLAKAGDPVGNSEFYDLTTWSKQNLIAGVMANHSEPNWVVTDKTAIQKTNAKPTVLLSDLDIKNQKIEGFWKAGMSGDDDFMGFVFAFKDAKTFYLFDWKKGLQGAASPGMSVKLVTANSELGMNDLWPTVGNGSRVKSLYNNSIPWAYDVKYSFSLNFVPGNTHILVKEDATILADISITDTTLSDGKFGFYNYSQDSISYEGFKKTPVQGIDYAYKVLAEDAEGDELKFSLEKSPSGMKVDSSSGVVTWPKSDLVAGNHEIVLRVEDKAGLFATQTYFIKVE